MYLISEIQNEIYVSIETFPSLSTSLAYSFHRSLLQSKAFFSLKSLV